MPKEIKIIIIALCSMALLGYFGCHGLAYSFYRQRTCEWANIDNIELHAHVNIPKITNSDCKYDKDQNTKMATFSIDRNNVDMIRYIQNNNLKQVISVTEPSFEKFLNLESKIEDLISTEDLYYRKGEDQGENWYILLDRKTGRLWVTINYSD